MSWDKERIAQIQLPDPADDDPHQMCIRDRVDRETGIALQIEGDGKAKRCTITDELDELRELQDTDFTIMSPISYFGPVSYTHLDVYKRQILGCGGAAKMPGISMLWSLTWTG